MGIIKLLDTSLINTIAAGEVIESPYSVVKELVENSLDAGATQIQIESVNAGLRKLVISDNGSGIAEEDLDLTIQRHATSKISQIRDLETILTYGFRGEALSSVAAISKLTLESGTSESSFAHQIYCENGSIIKKQIVRGFKGTTIIVEDLFYNTPVRRKFLKAEKSEERKLRSTIETIALAKNEVGFSFTQNNKKVLHIKTEDRKERIVSIFGETIRDRLLPVSLEHRGIVANGFISDPDFYKSNRTGQYIFVNDRPIDLKYSSYLLKKAYDELLPANVHPWCFLFFTIDPNRIDVNVHPAKKEIRFVDEEGFNGFFMKLILSTLRSSTPVSFMEMKHKLHHTPSIERTSYKANSSISDEKPLLQNFIHNDVHTIQPFDLNKAGAGTNLEDLTDSVEIHRTFIPKKHYGIIFGTFILAEAEDGLYIIDQHTAHERIRYEEVLRSFKKKNLSQKLLTPIRLEFSIQDAEELLEKTEQYKALGIIIDSLGEGTIVVREVPSFIEAGTEKEIILDFLNRTKSIEEPELYDTLAKSIACRSAIKKNDFVSDHLLGEILNRLSYCENPSRCPHGRPTLIKLTKDDLERMFHRKQ
jgi:DNA mismatch repair protein MutL